ncbi:MAG: hypothetical protein P4N60_10875 [Verrucomicrobiae bacterium]|nr:hypothetical protein [Verrucomicrobiae bacterium]
MPKLLVQRGEAGAVFAATGHLDAQETASAAMAATAKILAAKRFIEVRQKLAGTRADKSCKICRKTFD